MKELYLIVMILMMIILTQLGFRRFNNTKMHIYN